MPTFGEYEAISEPLALIDEGGRMATVWKARKSGDSNGAVFVVKCYSHAKSKIIDDPGTETLYPDAGLQFLESVRQLKKAHGDGGHCLAPIHAFGSSDDGVYYVTDYYRLSLKDWISRRGRVDNAGLRHVVYSVAVGCLALQKSCGRSHANLKAGNVLFAGKPRALRKTSLHLIDPAPVARILLPAPNTRNQRNLDDQIREATELHDLRGIGEMILQLVENRVIESTYDYNFPVVDKPGWQALGREGKQWLEVCNRLVKPQLTLQDINLRSLAEEFRPNPMLANLPLIAAGIAGLGLVIGGVHFGRPILEQWSKDRQAKRDTEYTNALGAAEQALKATNVAEAFRWGNQALKFRPADQGATELLGRADQLQKELEKNEAEQRYRSALASAKSAFNQKNYGEAIARADEALRIRPADPDAQKLKQEAEAGIKADAFEDQQRRYQTAMNEGRSALTQKQYTKAMAGADQALAIRPADADAQKLKQQAEEGNKADALRDEQQRKYQTAMNEGRSALTQKQYTKAKAGADQALAIRPSDPEALQLKTNAEAADTENKYQLVIEVGQRAFSQQDYLTAIARAENALVFKPNDETASNLKRSAQTEQNYRTAMQAGLGAFGRKEYAGAITEAGHALESKPNDVPALNLKRDAQKEEKYETALRTGRKAFSQDNFTQARDQAVLALETKADDPNALQLKKDAEARISGPATDGRAQLDRTLEVYEVRFWLKDEDPSITTPDGKQAKRLPKTTIGNKNGLIKNIDALRNSYQQAGLYDERKGRLDTLEKKIKQW